MAICPILCSGGGMFSDDVSASKSQVLEGFTAVTIDSNDEPIEGTMPNNGAWNANTTGDSKVIIPAGYHDGNGYVDGNGAYNKGISSAKKGNAGAGDVLSGKTFTNSSSIEATGTMPNRGAISASVRANSTYQIQNGYHNGNGIISGPTLDGDALVNWVLEGKTFYSDSDSMLTGTLKIASLTSFSVAAVVGKMVTFKWDVPNNGSPYSGVIIRYSTADYPTLTTGYHLYKGYGSSDTAGSKSTYAYEFDGETTYYVSAWSYVTSPTLGQTYNGETGVWINENKCTLKIETGDFVLCYPITRESNLETYTVQEKATADVYVIGGGGGGAAGRAYIYNRAYANGGGGGGGGEVIKLSLTAADTIQIGSIGIGGSGGSTSGANGTSGGDTSITFGGITYTAHGGDGGGSGINGGSQYAAGGNGASGSSLGEYSSSTPAGNGSAGTEIDGTYYGSGGGGGGESTSSSRETNNGKVYASSTYQPSGIGSSNYGSGGNGGSSSSLLYNGSNRTSFNPGSNGVDGCVLVVLKFPKSLQFDSSTTFTIPDKVKKIRYCVVAGGTSGGNGNGYRNGSSTYSTGGDGGKGGEVKIGELSIGTDKTITIEVGTAGNNSSIKIGTSESITARAGQGANGGGGASAGASPSDGFYGNNGSAASDGTEFNGIFYGPGGEGGSAFAGCEYPSGTGIQNGSSGSGGAGGKTVGAAGQGGTGGSGRAWYYSGENQWQSGVVGGSSGLPGIVIIEFLELEE